MKARTIFDRLMELWGLPWSEERYGEAQMLLRRITALVDGMAGPRITTMDYPEAAGSPINELRAAYQRIPAGTPADEDVLAELPRLYAAIEGVLNDNPCKELGEAYVECQRLLIEARAVPSVKEGGS